MDTEQTKRVKGELRRRNAANKQLEKAVKQQEYKEENSSDEDSLEWEKETTILETLESLGYFLQTNSCQLIIIVLLILDVLFLLSDYHSATTLTQAVILHDEKSYRPRLNRTLAIREVKKMHEEVIEFQKTANFTLITQCLIFLILTVELLFSALAFGKYVVNHGGYVIDFCVTLIITLYISGYGNIFGLTRFVFALNCCRFWRVIRFMNSLVKAVKQKLKRRKEDIAHQKDELDRMKSKITTLEYSLSREKDDRDVLKKTFVKQKEQIKTLEEALKIAANSFVEQEKKIPAKMRLDIFSSFQSELDPDSLGLSTGNEDLTNAVNQENIELQNQQDEEENEDYFYDLLEGRQL